MDATPTRLPSALECMGEFRRRLEGRTAAVFLDYDGTLTPIMPRPELAQVSSEMRGLVGELAEWCPVAIVSGRPLATVKEFLGLENVIYAGSHGMEIEGPSPPGLRLDKGRDHVENLAALYDKLSVALSHIPGVLMERTAYTVPVHFRQVHPALIPEVERIVEKELKGHSGIKGYRGKMIFEIRPDIAWDKGEAVLWMREQLGLNPENSVAFYLGDDTTDEDAFAILGDEDVGILVASRARDTAARYTLKDPAEVGAFLEGLIVIINASAGGNKI